MKTNPRHQLFVREFAACGNATKAAIAAGYSARTAKQQASMLLKNPKVKALFEQVMRPRLNSLEVSAERIRLERARMAFFDPADMFDENGQLLPVRKMSADARRALKGIEVSNGVAGEVVTKVRLVDRNPSLVALERMEGLYADEADRGGFALNIEIRLGGDDPVRQERPQRAPAPEPLPEHALGHAVPTHRFWPLPTITRTEGE